ncbi:hypothetical protein H0E87_016731 [Populus deltoides]|uniref:PGG domain-containing protein n=1 Tax=Populus deltoides TaxID=3696 RepID=A0A8T2YAJ9_POPDE|nr:hypothetical protein H0E87_016731 [Populus deltoides]
MLGFTTLHNIAYQDYQLSASLKRIAVTTLWPLGCLPILTAFSSYQNYSETWNIASKFHNQKLQQAIRRMNSESRLRTLLIPCCVGVTSNYSCGNFDKNGAKKFDPQIITIMSTAAFTVPGGILTSRYAEQDFLRSLPTKLIIGLSTLFISIATMMVAFCAALIILLDGKLQIVMPIVFLSGIPVTLFMLLQFPLLVEIFFSTYGPGIFDRKTKCWY